MEQIKKSIVLYLTLAQKLRKKYMNIYNLQIIKHSFYENIFFSTFSSYKNIW